MAAVIARSPSVSVAWTVTMYDTGSKWNVFTACTPALSRYSKRRSTAVEIGPGSAGAPLTA